MYVCVRKYTGVRENVLVDYACVWIFLEKFRSMGQSVKLQLLVIFTTAAELFSFILFVCMQV